MKEESAFALTPADHERGVGMACLMEARAATDASVVPGAIRGGRGARVGMESRRRRERPAFRLRGQRWAAAVRAVAPQWAKAFTERTTALEQMEPPGAKVRRERELAEQLLAQRAAQALTAAQIEPPPYIVKEPGKRPTEPTKARIWDQGVRESRAGLTALNPCGVGRFATLTAACPALGLAGRSESG